MTRVTNNSVQSSCDDCQQTPNYQHSNVNVAPFSGDPELLEFFISQITELASLRKWSDQFTLFYAKNNLQGPAKIFISQRAEYAPFLNSEDLFTTLRNQFSKPSTCKFITDFNNFQYLPGETIRNLKHRLDVLAPKAHISIKDANSLDAIKFNKFISCIPSDYRKHILQNNIITYREAVEKAILMQECDIGNAFLCQSSVTTTPIQKITEELHTLKQTVQQFSQAQTQPQNKNSQNRKFQKQRNNYENSNYRPYQKKWRNNRNNWSRFPSQNQNSNQHFTQPINTQHNFSRLPAPSSCEFCGNQGHTIRFCPQFKLHFVPISAPSNSQFFPSTSVPHNCPSSTVTSSQNDFSKSLPGSNLNPAADVFLPHPNW